MAKRNTDRMLRLINQILDFRKIQNDKMKVLVEQVDIIPLILKIYGNFVPMAHTHRIDFRLFCPLDSFVMYTDVDKLEKILFNLLSNAFKYTPDEKSISLSVTCEKQILCLQVKDEVEVLMPKSSIVCLPVLILWMRLIPICLPV